jgi:hypothetical protein
MRIDETVESPSPRFVVVHYHIFKNGGSTIDSILEREFPGAFATLHGAEASAALDHEHLKSFLRQHRGVAAVSSHHLRYPKPAIRDVIIFDCCFLRHPLERLDSLYRYLRTMALVDPLCHQARRMNARDFFRDLVTESPHLISDVQVTQMALSGAFTRPAHTGDLERATAIFCDAAIPGLVEMFDESLVAAEYFLRPAFPAVTWEYVPQNVSRASEAASRLRAEDSHDRLTRLWGGDVYEDLLRLNQLDLELFKRAQGEIRRRMALVPGSARRMDEFRTRCSQLRGEPAYDQAPVQKMARRARS